MAKRGATVTNVENITWTQRIKKEEKINAKSVPTFSVRAAVSVDDVPKKFKPGHMDHSHAMKGGEAAMAGLAPSGANISDGMAMESRKWITRQQAVPRERHQFPDTRGQEIGWCLSQPGVQGDRSVPYGSDASKLGLGWLQEDGHGGPTTRMAAERAKGQPLPPYYEAPRARRSKDNNIREEMGVPPYATLNTMEELTAMREGRNGQLDRRKLLHTIPSRRVAQQSKASQSERGKSLKKSSSEPGLRGAAAAETTGADADGVLDNQEKVVAQAFARSRSFLNGPHNPWFKPLSQSDVAQFANAYTECWGSCMFHKQK